MTPIPYFVLHTIRSQTLVSYYDLSILIKTNRQFEIHKMSIATTCAASAGEWSIAAAASVGDSRAGGVTNIKRVVVLTVEKAIQRMQAKKKNN